MRRLSGYRASAQSLLAVTLLLSGCASDPGPVAVAVIPKLAPSPAACRTAPKALPKLPDKALSTGEFAAGYNRLQWKYRLEAVRYRLCQAYVSRVTAK